MVYLIDASLAGGVLMAVDVTWDPVFFVLVFPVVFCVSLAYMPDTTITHWHLESHIDIPYSRRFPLSPSSESSNAEYHFANPSIFNSTH